MVHAYDKSKGFDDESPIRSLFDGYNRSLLAGRTTEDGLKIPRMRDRSPGLNPVKLSEAKRQESFGDTLKLPRDRIM